MQYEDGNTFEQTLNDTISVLNDTLGELNDTYVNATSDI